MCMSWAWHQMIEPMLSTTFCPCYACGTRWYYPCWAQYAWHSVYGLRTNEDCRGSHRLQLKKQLQGTWSVSCSAWIGCIHSNKTQICFQTSSIVQSSQTNCSVCNNRSIHVIVMTQTWSLFLTIMSLFVLLVQSLSSLIVNYNRFLLLVCKLLQKTT